MSDLHGVCVAMCTPFDDSGERIDEGRYKAHIDDLIDAGVHGLVLCSGTGEDHLDRSLVMRGLVGPNTAPPSPACGGPASERIGGDAN